MLTPSLPIDEASRLEALYSLNLLDTPPEERFDRITRLATQILKVPIALVSLIDSNRQWFKSCQGLEATETERSVSFCAHAILDDSLFIIPDTHLDERFADNPLVTGTPHVRFYAGQPLFGPDRHRVGTLCIIDVYPRHLNDKALTVIRDLAAWAEQELNSMELKRASIIIRDSEIRLRTVLDNILEGIITINASNIITSANPAAERLFGYSVAELIGQPAAFLLPGLKMARSSLYSSEYRADEASRPEITGFRKDGAHFFADLTIGEMQLAEGRGFILSVRDITQRKQIEQRLALKNAVTKVLATTTTMREVIPHILQTICESMEWWAGGWWLVDETSGSLRCETFWRRDNKASELETISCQISYSSGVGLLGRVWESGKAQWVSDMLSDKNCVRASYAVPYGLRMAVGFPVSHEGKVLGVLEFFGLGIQSTDLELLQLFDLLGAQIGQYVLREQAQQKLNESEQFLRGIYEGVAQSIFVVDVDQNGEFRYVGLNPAHEHFTGITNQDLRGKTPAQVLTSVGAEAVCLRYRECVQAGRPITYEEHLPFKEAYHCWITTLTPLYNEKGQIYRLVGTSLNITERKQMEEQLRESETKFRLLAETVSVGIFIVQNNQYLYVNPCLEAITGYTNAEFSSMSLWQIAHPDDLNDLTERSLARQRGEVVTSNYEFRFTRKDGEIRWIYVSIGVLEIEGHPAILGAALDTTERKRAEEERLLLERKFLETQKLESLGVLAGGIAHDFNNLLVGIMGNAELARLDLSPATSAYDSVIQVELAAQRAADLARQMLAYSGKGRFVIQPLNLSKLVEEIARLLKVSINPNATVYYQLAPNLPPIEGDATQLRQVIMNLLVNASDALQEQEGFIRVSSGVIEVDQDYLADTYLSPDLAAGQYVYLEVADTGCGMDAATLAKIFEPFFTTKFTGRGLGLAAVLGIVRSHKGALKVDSQPGLGTVFRILLPCLNSPLLSQNTSGSDALHLLKRLNGNNKTILVIDDEPMVLRMTTRLLERSGFQVVTANNGRQGVEIFQAEASKFSCVLSDLTMPQMNGEEVLNKIKQIQPDARVVLMTGYTEQEANRRFEGRGLDGFLQKPFALQELLEMLEKVLLKDAVEQL